MTDKLEEFTDMLGYFEQAARSERGIALEFESPEAAIAYRQKLYAVRREVGGYEFLSLIQSDNELWIAHNGQRQA